MARQNYWESDFISGELSPRLHARVDLQKYASGVSDLTNFIIQLQGGIYRRSGTVFVDAVKDSSAKTTLIPFIVEGDVAYVIEAGNNYFRFYADQGQLETGATTQSQVLTTNELITSFTLTTESGLVNGAQYVITGHNDQILNGSYFTKVPGLTQTLNQPAVTGTITPLTYTLTPNGGTILEIETPYATADLPLLDYAQSADTLFIVHPSYAPQCLKRVGVNSFVLTPFVFQDGPYMDQNQVQTALLEHSGFTQYEYIDPVSGVTYHQYNGNGTITASGTNADGTTFSPFAPTDVGRWVRILQGNFWGAVLITYYTDSQHVLGTVFGPVALADSGKNKVTIGSTTYPVNTVYPTYVWRLGSWSGTTGWPSCVTFHQGRLCFANSNTEPQGFWASESGIFNLFSPTENDVSVTDANGIAYTIASSQLNAVEWMLSAQALMVGTFGSEYAVLASSNSTPLTPSNIAFQQQTAFGSKKIRPFLIGVSVLYVQRSGEKLREQTYDWSINGWRSTEISMLSEHLFREGGGIVQATYQQEPSNIWWGCRADGTLIGMTYVKEQSILGFHKHVIGGTFNGGQAVVESVCSIPTPDGNQDQLWLIVKRTVNGNTVRYIEYLDVPFDASVAGKNTMNFVDCGVQSTGFPVPLGSPVINPGGLGHLVGETVAICGDGSVQPSKVVDSMGKVTLSNACSLLTIGLSYISQMTTLEFPVQGDFGTSQGITKRIDRLIFRLLNSLTFKFGKDYDNLTSVVLGGTNSSMDNSPPLFTGDKDVLMPSNYAKEAKVSIQVDQPYPLNLIGMSPQLVVQPR